MAGPLDPNVDPVFVLDRAFLDVHQPFPDPSISVLFPKSGALEGSYTLPQLFA